MKSQKRFREICSRVFNGIRLKKKNMELRNQSMKKLKKNSHNNENICARKYLFAKLYSR